MLIIFMSSMLWMGLGVGIEHQGEVNNSKDTLNFDGRGGQIKRERGEQSTRAETKSSRGVKS